MTKAILVLLGTIYWLFLHRVVYIYMGEATLLSMLTALVGYVVLNRLNPQRWTPWHVISFMAGGIFLEGISRFLA